MGSGVLRRSKVARMARASTSPSNSKSRARTIKSQKSLHAAVREAELHDGIELLRDDSLARIGAEARGRIVEQRWELRHGCFRGNRVSEPDVDLQAYPR